MKYIITLGYLSLLISCTNNESLREKELELKEKELEVREKELELAKSESNKEKIVSNNSDAEPSYSPSKEIKTKYVYIVCTTDEPILKVVQKPIEDRFKEYLKDIQTLPSKSVVWETNSYTSDIIKVQNYNEDEKFIIQDKFKSNILLGASQRDFKVHVEIANPDLDKLYVTRITGCKSFVFDSYKEASIHLSK